MRTYAGHSSARASNALFRSNLAKGQTGLSVAFDLPTQLGYDPDLPQASSEVGKVGVAIAHLGDMRELFDGIPLDAMNTSMTINATAPWLFSLYLALASEQGVNYRKLAGTTQNDIVKEYLSRGTFIFPPEASKRLTVDLICYSVKHVPKWNPINVCSYHLQEAGATPVQEVAYALASAIGVLDAALASNQVNREEFERVVGRISFFVNSGTRIVTEISKMRAFTRLWDEISRDRYGIGDPNLRRFRYGVQVNSLGLTEVQPENNVYRILLSALGVTMSRGARARALQLPAWNEAIGLPRPFDQQWSLRAQQILAFETDLLEYPDIFEGSRVVEEMTAEICSEAMAEVHRIVEAGGVFAQIEELKTELVRAQAARTHQIETGEQVVVGLNRFAGSEQSPLVSAGSRSHYEVDPVEIDGVVAALASFKAGRDRARVGRALAAVAAAARDGSNIVPPSVELARAGGTTQEWADTLREVFGVYRAPTGIRGAHGVREEHLSGIASRLSRLPGGPPRLLVAKPGMDGHSNGAEQIAAAARDSGFEVIYQGIRQTPAEIAAAARDEDVDLIGLSILSGSHERLIAEVMEELLSAGVSAPVVVGGIIPADDAARLKLLGVRAVYTPRDYQIAGIMADLAELAESQRLSAQDPGPQVEL